MSFVCIGTTPALQRVMVLSKFTVNAVNRATSTLNGIAGKAVNVAKVLAALGETSEVLGFVGGETGHFLLEELANRRIASHFVEVPPPTRQCITVLDQSARTQTELVEESQAVEPRFYAQLLESIRNHLPGRKCAIMSGTLTPKAPGDFYAQCVALARQSGIFSVVDAKGEVLLKSLDSGPDLVKPNRDELALTLGAPLDSEAAVLRAASELCQRGARRVVVTAGAAPTLAFDSRCCWRIISPHIQPLNPIGSGDAFTAALSARLTRGDDLGEACRWGAAAGAANALTLMPGEMDPTLMKSLLCRVEIHQISA